MSAGNCPPFLASLEKKWIIGSKAHVRKKACSLLSGEREKTMGFRWVGLKDHPGAENSRTCSPLRMGSERGGKKKKGPPKRRGSKGGSGLQRKMVNLPSSEKSL